ncbi:MAG: DUF2167 domain-containing protein [Cellulophaga sp.]
MKKLLVFILCVVCSFYGYSQTEDEAYNRVIDSIEKSLNYEYGIIDLQGGIATLTVPDGYKFLGAEQSKYVLSDLWGNPPSDVLGLLFPKDISPLGDGFSYAVEVTYSEEGYVEDEDAEDIDYEELLETMQKDATEANPERIKQGYEAITLVGWASAPFYDKTNKKLHWAKELKFGDMKVNTLNYNIRILGRKGYMNMNAIGDIDVLPTFKKDIDVILSSVEFNDGNRYADFDADFDDVAAYGIGGLVAGKILAKVGFFAVLLKFWKIIAVAVVGGFSVFRKKFFGGSTKEEKPMLKENNDDTPIV